MSHLIDSHETQNNIDKSFTVLKGSFIAICRSVMAQLPLSNCPSVSWAMNFLPCVCDLEPNHWSCFPPQHLPLWMFSWLNLHLQACLWTWPRPEDNSLTGSVKKCHDEKQSILFWVRKPYHKGLSGWQYSLTLHIVIPPKPFSWIIS